MFVNMKAKKKNTAKTAPNTIIRKFVEAKKTPTGKFIASIEVRDAEGELIKLEGGDFERFLKNPVFLWGHRMTEGDLYDILGKCTQLSIETNSDGIPMLTFIPEYAKHQKAQDAKAMHDMDMAIGISIGFGIDSDGYDFETKTITKWELYEISNVIVGSNPDALQIAKSKGLLTPDEAENAKKLSIYPIKSKKLKEYRKMFMSENLCKILGYAKTGNEVVDAKNIYDLIISKLNGVQSVNQNEQAVKRVNPVKMSVSEVTEIIRKAINESLDSNSI